MIQILEKNTYVILERPHSGTETLVRGDKASIFRKVTTYLLAIKELLLLVARVKLSLNPKGGAMGVWLYTVYCVRWATPFLGQMGQHTH